MRPIGQTAGAWDVKTGDTLLLHSRLARRRGSRVSPVFVLLGMAVCALAASPQVTAVRFWSLGDATRVAIETDSEVQYHAERIDSPERIFVDLAGARRQAGTRGLQVIPVGDKLVKQIRVALAQPGTLRVVLDLSAPVEYSISQLTNPDRIIIELRVAGKGPVLPPTRSVTGGRVIVEPSAEPAATPNIETPKPTPPPIEMPKAQATPPPAVKIVPSSSAETPAPKRTEPAATPKVEVAVLKTDAEPVRTAPKAAHPAASSETAMAAKRDSHGDRSLIRALGLKIDRVVIDPGHGGHDTGTIGPGGLMEKDLVLDVGRRLGALITQRLGSEVIFTRSDDTFIPLEQRTQIANEKQADLFLSIHANSSQLPRIAGSETFYLNFTTSEDALEVAARENATSSTSIHELQTLVQKITLNEKVQESRELATIIQKALYTYVPRNRSYKNRGIKKAPFVVLIGAQMPSVLAEVAFLSNPKDESLLKKPEYRQKVAEALFRGVSQYADALSHLQVARQRRQESQTQ